MSTPRSGRQKIADWLEVFTAVSAELSPPAMRGLMAQEVTENVAELQFRMHVSRQVTANDRTAAIVAAMLTVSGVARPVFVNDAGE